MKRLSKGLLFLTLLAVASLTGQAQIKWFEGSFEQAKAQAKKENKHLYLYAYTTW